MAPLAQGRMKLFEALVLAWVAAFHAHPPAAGSAFGSNSR